MQEKQDFLMTSFKPINLMVFIPLTVFTVVPWSLKIIEKTLGSNVIDLNLGHFVCIRVDGKTGPLGHQTKNGYCENTPYLMTWD